jgi:hypothetical protein
MSFTAVNARRAGWIFLAGTVLVCGLEWLYRLGREPRRLAQRYFRNNPLFVLKFSGQLADLKKHPSP